MSGIDARFVEGEPPGLDQFWHCPLCDAQIAMGKPAKLHPPKCAPARPSNCCRSTTSQSSRKTPHSGHAVDSTAISEPQHDPPPRT